MKKKEKRVYLAAIRRDLQAQYQYESREKRNWAFEVLYHGWRQKCIRNGRQNPFFSVIWKRGWVAKRDARSLRKYIGLS